MLRIVLSESIENRSWIPTQDSPGIRQTWEATIHVPAGLTAVMSAPRIEQPITQGGESVFNFRMDHSVAPYMIAIAVGDLTFKSLGPRTGVWAEPATITAAARELADTEKMVAAAEKLYGPYRWGRYDVLVLPPSFPYGGEENPNMTFLTPTFIAGDKSLVSLVAHELSHSWSGNLATNATWNDFWLNEGITTYAERRIVEELYGKKQADEEIALGIDALNKAVAENGGPSGPDTRLHLNLKGRNPDDGLTDIAYEKGAAFMRTIEAIASRHGGETIVVVSHGLVLDALYRTATGMALEAPRGFPLLNCSVNTFRRAAEGWHAVAMCDVGHLAEDEVFLGHFEIGGAEGCLLLLGFEEGCEQAGEPLPLLLLRQSGIAPPAAEAAFV